MENNTLTKKFNKLYYGKWYFITKILTYFNKKKYNFITILVKKIKDLFILILFMAILSSLLKKSLSKHNFPKIILLWSTAKVVLLIPSRVNGLRDLLSHIGYECGQTILYNAFVPWVYLWD